MGEHSEHLSPKRVASQKWSPVFGREDDVYPNLRMRLRHDRLPRCRKCRKKNQHMVNVLPLTIKRPGRWPCVWIPLHSPSPLGWARQMLGASPLRLVGCEFASVLTAESKPLGGPISACPRAGGWTSLKEAEVSSRFFLVFGRGQRVPLSGTAEAVISKLMKVLC